MGASWHDGLMLNVRLRRVGQHPESWPISNQIVGVIVVESHHWRHHKRAGIMCPRALRKWDDEECLVKKKSFFLVFILASVTSLIVMNHMDAEAWH